jgi:hypothetical protein
MKQMPVVQSTLTRKIFFSSTVIRSRITNTHDDTRQQGDINYKLDYIIRMLEDKKISPSVPKVKATGKQSSSVCWEDFYSE